MTLTTQQLLLHNEELRSENGELRQRVSQLEKMLAVFDRHPTLAQGIRGETIIARAINGALTSHNASCDVIVPSTNLRVEVKYSGLNDAIRGRITKKTYRWAWANPFGENGNKVFDRLLLVGEADTRNRDKYRDPTSPYVFFDVPFGDIMPLTITTNNGRFRSIQLTTNPLTARSAASPLFTMYHDS